jgi:hypothetical protein
MIRKKGIVILVLTLLISGISGCGAGNTSSPESSAALSDGSGPAPIDDGSGSPVNNSSGNGGSGNGTTSATLTWDAPTKNTDGTALTDLAGYKIHYGTASKEYGHTITTGLVKTYSLQNLEPGTYYMVVTAFNAAGSESAPSNEATKTIN